MWRIFFQMQKKNKIYLFKLPGWGRPGGTLPSWPSRCTSRWLPLPPSPRWPFPSVGRTVGCKAPRFHWLEAPGDDMCQICAVEINITSLSWVQSTTSKVDFRCRLQWWLSINQSHKLVIFNADFKSDLVDIRSVDHNKYQNTSCKVYL